MLIKIHTSQLYELEKCVVAFSHQSKITESESTQKQILAYIKHYLSDCPLRAHYEEQSLLRIRIMLLRLELQDICTGDAGQKERLEAMQGVCIELLQSYQQYACFFSRQHPHRSSFIEADGKIAIPAEILEDLANQFYYLYTIAHPVTTSSLFIVNESEQSTMLSRVDIKNLESCIHCLKEVAYCHDDEPYRQRYHARISEIYQCLVDGSHDDSTSIHGDDLYIYELNFFRSLAKESVAEIRKNQTRRGSSILNLLKRRHSNAPEPKPPEPDDKPIDLENFLTSTKALERAGFPHALAANFAMLTNLLGDIPVAVRVGNIPRLDLLVTFKPSSIATKTSNYENGGVLVEGLICRDQETFGRKGSAALPVDCRYTRLNYPIITLIKFIEKGELDIEQIGTTLILTPPVAARGEFRCLQYRIDFYQSTENRHPTNASQLRPWETSEQVSKPLWWDPQFGEFDILVQRAVDIQYRREYFEKWQDHDVASDESGLYYTTDFDMALIGHPRGLPENAYKVFDCREPDSRSKLLAEIPHIASRYHEVLHKQILNSELKITLIEKNKPKPNTPAHNEYMHLQQQTLKLRSYYQWFSFQPPAKFIETVGLVTPFECLFIMLANQLLQQQYPKLPAMLVHGPDNHNPYGPSEINAPLLFFYAGLIVQTEDQNSLLAFLIQPRLIKNYFFHIHPQWHDGFKLALLKAQHELTLKSFPETVKVHHEDVASKSGSSTPRMLRKMSSLKPRRGSVHQMEQNFASVIATNKTSPKRLSHTAPGFARSQHEAPTGRNKGKSLL